MIRHELEGARCTASAAFFGAAASVALNQASRSSSSFASVGQPNQAFSPVPRIGKLTAGLTMSGPTSQVWKIDQPPLSTGSFDVRRVISVPQSPACSSTLSADLAQVLGGQQRLRVHDRLVGGVEITTIFSPL